MKIQPTTTQRRWAMHQRLAQSSSCPNVATINSGALTALERMRIWRSDLTRSPRDWSRAVAGTPSRAVGTQTGERDKAHRSTVGIRAPRRAVSDDPGVDPNAGKPPMSRLLSAGAKGAERMAQATGVDPGARRRGRGGDRPRAAQSRDRRAIERAIETMLRPRAIGDDIARIVKQVLESEAADQAWAEVLASRQAQMLVERIAGAPELRAAIAAQSAGLITDIGVRADQAHRGARRRHGAGGRGPRPRTRRSTRPGWPRGWSRRGSTSACCSSCTRWGPRSWPR